MQRLVLLGLLLLGNSSLVTLDSWAQALPPVAVMPAPPESVVVASSSAMDSIRGVVKAVNQATLSAPIEGRIEALPFRAGQAFDKGALLVAFNCDELKSQARAAQAAVQIQRRTLETNTKLEEYQSIGQLEVQISRAQLSKARAEAEALQNRLKGCEIRAPFSGQVVERLANVYESVAATQPVITIVNARQLEVELIVPSSWLNWVHPGMRFRFHIDETEAEVQGQVIRLLPVVDPVSKTVKLIGELNSDGEFSNRVLPGMSGNALFPTATLEAGS